MTMVPSTSNPGRVRGSEPGASTTASAASSTSPELPPETVTLWSAWSRPWPSNIVTLRPLRRVPSPDTSPVTMASLRASDTLQSSVGSPAFTP
jgi:hypothetical protein